MSRTRAKRGTRAKSAALILAAGRGTRVGGAKALMIVDGAPLGVAHVRARLGDCDRVVIVAREEVVAILRAEEEGNEREAVAGVVDALRGDGRVRGVVSREPEELGPAGSIRAAVKEGALDGCERVLVTPVDVSPASTSVVRSLFDALSDPDVDAVRFEHGHPIAIRREILVDRYTREAGPLRDVVTSLGDRVRVLPLPAEGLPRPLDRVDDVVALTGAPPRFWSHA